MFDYDMFDYDMLLRICAHRDNYVINSQSSLSFYALCSTVTL